MNSVNLAREFGSADQINIFMHCLAIAKILLYNNLEDPAFSEVQYRFICPTMKSIFYLEGKQLFNELLGELKTAKHIALQSPMTVAAVQACFINTFIFTVGP